MRLHSLRINHIIYIIYTGTVGERTILKRIETVGFLHVFTCVVKDCLSLFVYFLTSLHVHVEDQVERERKGLKTPSTNRRIESLSNRIIDDDRRAGWFWSRVRGRPARVAGTRKPAKNRSEVRSKASKHQQWYQPPPRYTYRNWYCCPRPSTSSASSDTAKAPPSLPRPKSAAWS